MLPLWTDARNPAPVSSTGGGISVLPFARVSCFTTPFYTASFQGVRQSYTLIAGDWAAVANHDGIFILLRPCRWGLGDKLTGCSFVSLRNLWSGHNSVPISRKKAAEQKSHLYTEIHTDTSTSPVLPCVSSGSFPKEQAERLRGQDGAFLKRLIWGSGFIYLGYCFGTG